MSAVTASLCCTLMFVVFLSADQKSITAESGQDVTLTCRAPNNNITVVEWNRADLGDEYVFVYRSGQFDPDNQHPSFKNRVDLQDRQMKDGDVSLILKDVAINDTGTYECGVVHRVRGHMTLISRITLSVVPPGQTNTEDGGKEDGGKEDRGKEDRLKVPVVYTVVLLFFVSLAVSFAGLAYRRKRRYRALHLQPEYQKIITADSGQKKVTLKCRDPDNNITAVKWSREDLGDEYVFWSKVAWVVPYHQHPSFVNRVDLQDRHMMNGNVSLILKDVTIDDAGTYECCVYKAETRSWKPISIIKLRVDPDFKREPDVIYSSLK